MKIRNNVKPSLPPIPGGTYLAICVYSIGIGEQLCEYEGKSKNYYNQVMLGFEICGQTVEIDGKQEPRVLSKTFNATKRGLPTKNQRKLHKATGSRHKMVSSRLLL